jgi:chromosome segregation ATPase
MGGIALIVGGCAADDPGKGGFFGGLIGLGSGSYERRAADRTEAWKAEEARYQEELASKNELDGALRDRRTRAVYLERQVAMLQQHIDELNAEIDSLETEEHVTSEEIEQAEAGVASLLKDIDELEEEKAAQEQARSLGAEADSETDPAQFGEPPPEKVSEMRAYITRLQEAVDELKTARDRHAREAAPLGDADPQETEDP